MLPDLTDLSKPAGFPGSHSRVFRSVDAPARHLQRKLREQT